MIYKLASRDNINSENFESWPAVLNKTFTLFNNHVEELIFYSEDEVLNWLESKSRTKSASRSANMQEFRNGDPNKLYSLYCCDHSNPYHDQNDLVSTPYSSGNTNKGQDQMEDNDCFMYSLRIKKPHEAYMTFMNEKSTRIKSSFKKIDVQLVVKEQVEHSSDIREIRKEYYEGIYPLEIDTTDHQSVKYMEYVNSVNEKDTDENKEKNYSIVTLTAFPGGSKWLDNFIRRLSHLEKFLDFFARGGNTFVNIMKDEEQIVLNQYILKLLSDNQQNTPEDDDLQTKVKLLICDPVLYTNEKYQVRCGRTLISWHKNYKYIIEKYNLIPSIQFSKIVLNFNLCDFFKQSQSKENLRIMIKNIEEIYGIKKKNVEKNMYMPNNMIIKNKTSHSKFNTIVKSFNKKTEK